MAWIDALKELVEAVEPVAKKIASKGLSIEAALGDPDVVAGLDKIVAIVANESKVEELMEASRAFSKQHEMLMKVFAVRPLTDEEFRKLGALGAAAYALSAKAFAKASTPGAILSHTVTVVYPYVKILVSLGLVLL